MNEFECFLGYRDAGAFVSGEAGRGAIEASVSRLQASESGFFVKRVGAGDLGAFQKNVPRPRRAE
jgi:hypothetical protein